MEFKSLEELNKEWEEKAKDIQEPFKTAYLYGRLEVAYELLHKEYESLTKNKRK